MIGIMVAARLYRNHLSGIRGLIDAAQSGNPRPKSEFWIGGRGGSLVQKGSKPTPLLKTTKHDPTVILAFDQDPDDPHNRAMSQLSHRGGVFALFCPISDDNEKSLDEDGQVMYLGMMQSTRYESAKEEDWKTVEEDARKHGVSSSNLEYMSFRTGRHFRFYCEPLECEEEYQSVVDLSCDEMENRELIVREDDTRGVSIPYHDSKSVRAITVQDIVEDWNQSNTWNEHLLAEVDADLNAPAQPIALIFPRWFLQWLLCHCL